MMTPASNPLRAGALNDSPPSPPTGAPAPLPSGLLDSEARFYDAYSWCLDACPTIGSVVRHLRDELSRLGSVGEGWQRAEVRTNVYLLACAITDAVDDYLLATGYDFSRAAAVPFGRAAVWAADAMSAAWRTARHRYVSDVHRWRDAWTSQVDAFLERLVADDRGDARDLAEPASGLAARLATFPARAGRRRARIPAAFRTQDLTHVDILALAHRLAASRRDREQPIIAIGLRTAGSYFAPLIRASLAHNGYRDVQWITIRPKRGLAPWERATLTEVAGRGGYAVIVDEAPNTGGTVAGAIALVATCGFAPARQAVLLPIHPTRPDWAQGSDILSLRGARVLTLEPGDWQKASRLSPECVAPHITEYFAARGYPRATIVASHRAAAFNRQLERCSEQKFHTRLKRVYEVRLEDTSGTPETRYVVAKSVGWGWLGYHAFICAARLAPLLPPVLGLRDGVLYAEWLPSGAANDVSRHRLIGALASYTAARVKRLALNGDPAADLAQADQHRGSALLAEVLAKAHGWKPAAFLRRPRLRRELTRRPCPSPTLIDGKMRPQEWIVSGPDLVKTDFEHHGLGKTELNVTDPAYDLADAILQFRLSPEEERSCLRRYVAESGDAQVETRLFLHKLLAGAWAMNRALDNLADARLLDRHGDFNEDFLNARHFLTTHTMRHCASACHHAATIEWRSPLVVLDVDGVLDKGLFGFPSTTAAGIEAISLLHAHGYAVALNTARNLTGVKEYCAAYGLVGGVADYGGVAWDAVTGREHRLASDESLEQLERVRLGLRNIPGVFLDETHQYSIRAYTFERGATVPLPTMLVRNQLAATGGRGLTFHQTFLDSTILPGEIDKGKGLLALLRRTGHADTQTVAIGDSEADLPMFGVATRSFAPSHISGRTPAKRLGCRIMGRPFQLGFLDAVRAIVHEDGGRCDRCRTSAPALPDGDLFAELLRAADDPKWRLLLRALVDPMALQVFAK